MSELSYQPQKYVTKDQGKKKRPSFVLCPVSWGRPCDTKLDIVIIRILIYAVDLTENAMYAIDTKLRSIRFLPSTQGLRPGFGGAPEGP